MIETEQNQDEEPRLKHFNFQYHFYVGASIVQSVWARERGPTNVDLADSPKTTFLKQIMGTYNIPHEWKIIRFLVLIGHPTTKGLSILVMEKKISSFTSLSCWIIGPTNWSSWLTPSNFSKTIDWHLLYSTWMENHSFPSNHRSPSHKRFANSSDEKSNSSKISRTWNKMEHHIHQHTLYEANQTFPFVSVPNWK